MLLKLPRHVGMILDGNRRWARERGLADFEGHREGVKNVERIALFAFDQGVEVVSVYSLSFENLFSRSKEELEFLFELFREAYESAVPRFHKENIRLRFIGNLPLMPSDIQQKTIDAEELTRLNSRGTFVVTLAYGGRDEIARAVRKIIDKSTQSADVTEELIASFLDTHGLPDPDLIIRTGGEQRISNFLLWQGAYAELYTCSKYWPEFNEEDFLEALKAYSQRERRRGGDKAV